MNLLLTVLVSLASLGGEIKIEAESASLSGVTIDTVRAGFSGTGYVTSFDEPSDSLDFQFEAKGGLFELKLNVAFTNNRRYQVWVNGVSKSSTFIRGNGLFGERSLGMFRLTEGTNQVVLTDGSGYDVDYLRLVPVEYPLPVTPPVALTDPLARASARALVSYLTDQYGKKVLSGQQDLSDVEYIKTVTGKTPAIGAFDLMDYSPSRVERGSNPSGSTERWIAWAGRDGIVSLCWHWNAPTDLIDTDGKEWWRGFYTEATTLDFAEALEDTTSERYHLLLRDIDAIAVQLRKFQDADIPVLWRPLHEASGGWFWWGAKGPAPFITLWRLLYDRLVRVNGLHNLIWVYTHNGVASWYPGDEYVDIVSRDLYEDPSATLKTQWDEMQELFGGRKLVTLSETGSIPDPDTIRLYATWWNWFAVWSGSFIRDIDKEALQRVYNDTDVITRDELPDWRAYATAIDPAAPTRGNQLSLFPNPTAGSVTLHLERAEAGVLEVSVYDVLGRRVLILNPGFLQTGPIELRLDTGDLGAGVYLVSVSSGTWHVMLPLVRVR